MERKAIGMAVGFVILMILIAVALMLTSKSQGGSMSNLETALGIVRGV
ncbi:MAG: hypothetical protein HYT73_01730 [Candidatus Aenigmarchaeota archaeon]|nr:hypothetical protein [Candidatus Aenigmarchaeota archaeon]